MASRLGDGPGCFVLLLDACTYDDDTLAADVLAALDEGQRVVLVHDVRVAFSDVIQRTPASLMARGIYDELAVQLYAGEHRRVSLHHVAAKMGAAAPESKWSLRVRRQCAFCRAACIAAASNVAAWRARWSKMGDMDVLLPPNEVRGSSNRGDGAVN